MEQKNKDQFGSDQALSRCPFDICGNSLRDYTVVIYVPDCPEYRYTKEKRVVPPLERAFESTVGFVPKIVVAKDDQMLPETGKRFDYEILIGNRFQRKGVPEYRPGSLRYGVTEDGPVFFLTPVPVFAGQLWVRFLEEFAGHPSNSDSTYSEFSLREGLKEEPLVTRDSISKLGYRKVFEDRFDGTEVNWEEWKTWTDGPSSCGFLAKSQLSLSDGKLIISGDWKENGEYGTGWYSGGIGTVRTFCRGYFECTMKCSQTYGRGCDFWSAFWIWDRYMHSAGGPGGCEMDIVENFGKDYHTSCFWVSETEEEQDLSNELYEAPFLGLDFENEFHVFGLLWDRDLYRVYIDGVLICASKYCYGTSEVPETVWLNLCVPEKITRSHDEHTEMVVDNIQVWQLPEDTVES